MRATPVFLLSLLLLLKPCQPMITPEYPLLPAPPPTAGGDLSSSPSHGWGWVSSSPSSPTPSMSPDTYPLLPKEGTPSALTPSGAPESGSGIPFLSSNPAAPLPNGMTDTATIRPLSTPGDETQVAGFGSSSIRMERGLLMFAMMCSALGLWM